MKIQILKDILKTKVDGQMRYSQGRIYLFVFVLGYIAALSYFMFKPNKDSMSSTIDALQWAILLFAAYVFGDKGVTATKEVFKMRTDAKIGVMDKNQVVVNNQNIITDNTPDTTQNGQAS